MYIVVENGETPLRRIRSLGYKLVPPDIRKSHSINRRFMRAPGQGCHLSAQNRKWMCPEQETDVTQILSFSRIGHPLNKK